MNLLVISVCQTRRSERTLTVMTEANVKISRGSTVAGAAVWLLLLFIPFGDSDETELIQRILLLGVLVIVPLGLSLVAVGGDGRSPWSYPVALVMQPFGAAAVVASFFIDPGLRAAGLAFAWLAVTLSVSLVGLSRLLRPDLRSAADFCTTAALLYIPVGAVWLIMSRWGIQPLGFGNTIVLLTAVHFHFAGFAAPILAGLAGQRLSPLVRRTNTFRIAAIGIITGTPLVAGGITFSPVLALIGAIVISTGLIALSVVVIVWVSPAIRPRPAQVLLIISSVATLPAMALAMIYAYSIVFNKLIVDIPQMAMTHGVANAFGFALCGLIAWSLINHSNTQRGQ